MEPSLAAVLSICCWRPAAFGSRAAFHSPFPSFTALKDGHLDIPHARSRLFSKSKISSPFPAAPGGPEGRGCPASQCLHRECPSSPRTPSANPAHLTQHALVSTFNLFASLRGLKYDVTDPVVGLNLGRAGSDGPADHEGADDDGAYRLQTRQRPSRLCERWRPHTSHWLQMLLWKGEELGGPARESCYILHGVFRIIHFWGWGMEIGDSEEKVMLTLPRPFVHTTRITRKISIRNMSQ